MGLPALAILRSGGDLDHAAKAMAAPREILREFRDNAIGLFALAIDERRQRLAIGDIEMGHDWFRLMWNR